MSEGSVIQGNPPARSRGRPRGSRNRPKEWRAAPPLIVLTVPPGVDLINWVIGYCVSNRICINVLHGIGTISGVALTDPRSPNPPLQLTEVLGLISISGACFYPITSQTIFNTFLSRANGAVISGIALRMTTRDPVVLHAVGFGNPFVIAGPRA